MKFQPKTKHLQAQYLEERTKILNTPVQTAREKIEALRDLESRLKQAVGVIGLIKKK